MSEAVSVEPSVEFYGSDGNWSTFSFQVGTPPQILELLPSTSGSETWVVMPEACNTPVSDCYGRRGHLYNISLTSTWEPKGYHDLDWHYGIEVIMNSSVVSQTAKSLQGLYGVDTITPGRRGNNGVRVNQSVLAGISTPEGPYLGQIGLSHRSANLTDSGDKYPSFLSLLKQNEKIQSLSYGYTAGASYRSFGENSSGVLGSLTLGGYDRSRFVAHNMTFNIPSNGTSNLPVHLKGIEARSWDSGKAFPMIVLENPTYVFIDSATPYMWLPENLCSLFASMLDLTYNKEMNWYYLSATTYLELVQKNVTFNFTFVNKDSQTININLPYKSFDLVESADPDEKVRYFPLRKATEDQYILGRAFLQEAYLIVDYERGNFSIYQAQHSAAKDIIAIEPVIHETPRPLASTDDTTGGSPTASSDNLSVWIWGIVLPGAIIFGFVAILMFVRKYGKKPSVTGRTSVHDIFAGKTELDGQDARHEAGHHPRGAELGIGLRAELYGSHMAPQLLENTIVTAEMGSDGVVHEVSAEAITTVDETPRQIEHHSSTRRGTEH